MNHYDTNCLAYLGCYLPSSLHPGRFCANHHTTGRYLYPTPFTNEQCNRYTRCPANSNRYSRA